MIIPEYDADKEYEVVGEYPPIKGLEIFGEGYFPSTPQYNRPISPRENYHRLMHNKTALWMPEVGWTQCDIQQFRPRQHPDNLGNHQCIDGGEKPDFAILGDEVIGWFDIPFKWEPGCGGAMPRPGFVAIDDMNDWETLNWPDLDDFDWDAIHDMNVEYLGTNKANQLGVQFGFWERMMNLMGVSDAAMALIDEDQEDAIHAFLDRLADTYIDYITRMNTKVGRIDSVFLHDDWGTQNGPFFSLETCEEFFVPPMKKVVDACHAQGIVFEHHCCGKAQNLVPAMLQTGSDYWCPQIMNDMDMMLEEYKDEHFTFSILSPMLPKGASDAQIDEMGHEFVEKYWKYGCVWTKNADWFPNPNHDQDLYPDFQKAVYKYSRLAHAGEEVEDFALAL